MPPSSLVHHHARLCLCPTLDNLRIAPRADIDDYGSFRGCAAAVDEYRAARGRTEPLHPIVAGARGKFQALWWRRA